MLEYFTIIFQLYHVYESQVILIYVLYLSFSFSISETRPCLHPGRWVFPRTLGSKQELSEKHWEILNGFPLGKIYCSGLLGAKKFIILCLYMSWMKNKHVILNAWIYHQNIFKSTLLLYPLCTGLIFTFVVSWRTTGLTLVLYGHGYQLIPWFILPCSNPLFGGGFLTCFTESFLQPQSLTKTQSTECSWFWGQRS